MTTNKWHLRFIDLAAHIARWSKDPSTKVGAVIIGHDRKPRSFGYNGPPRDVDDNPIEHPGRHTRPQKYLYWEHAERNAIYNADVKLDQATMYVTHYPCADCARAIIQKRISHVVVPSEVVNKMDHWADSQKAARTMFAEAGVEVVFVQASP